jgi:hypothetical protein
MRRDDLSDGSLKALLILLLVLANLFVAFSHDRARPVGPAPAPAHTAPSTR